MRRTSLTAILLMTALVGKLPSPAAAAGDDKATTIDALVREAGIAGDGPGVAILVRGTKGVLFRKGDGVADGEQ